MRFFILPTFFVFTIFLKGCGGGSQTPTNSANANSINTNVSKANADNPLSTNKAPEEATVNKAETIAPVVQAYCDAMRKKDDAALKKVYSQPALKSFAADMKTGKQTSLSKFLSGEPVGDKPCEVRNEKIEGERAVAEVRTETYPNGIKMYFVKENGEWKMTNESPEFQSVRQSSSGGGN